MSLKINTSTGEPASISIESGISKKTQKPWRAVKIQVGEWSTLIFPKSTFEMKYISQTLGEDE